MRCTRSIEEQVGIVKVDVVDTGKLYSDCCRLDVHDDLLPCKVPARLGGTGSVSILLPRGS